jgi:hypothetical protein
MTRFHFETWCVLMCLSPPVFLGAQSDMERTWSRRAVEVILSPTSWHSVGYGTPKSRTANEYAKHRTRSHRAEIRVYDDADNVIETHEHKGDFKEC